MNTSFALRSSRPFAHALPLARRTIARIVPSCVRVLRHAEHRTVAVVIRVALNAPFQRERLAILSLYRQRTPRARNARVGNARSQDVDKIVPVNRIVVPYS